MHCTVRLHWHRRAASLWSGRVTTSLGRRASYCLVARLYQARSAHPICDCRTLPRRATSLCLRYEHLTLYLYRGASPPPLGLSTAVNGKECKVYGLEGSLFGFSIVSLSSAPPTPPRAPRHAALPWLPPQGTSKRKPGTPTNDNLYSFQRNAASAVLTLWRPVAAGAEEQQQ